MEDYSIVCDVRRGSIFAQLEDLRNNGSKEKKENMKDKKGSECIGGEGGGLGGGGGETLKEKLQTRTVGLCRSCVAAGWWG